MSDPYDHHTHDELVAVIDGLTKSNDRLADEMRPMLEGALLANDAKEQALATVARLETENTILAAGACPEGDHGLVGDDRGHFYCKMKAERDRLAAKIGQYRTARDTACRLSEIAIAALAFIDALPTPQVMTAEQQEAWDRLQALR